MSEYNSIVQGLKAPKDKKNDFGKYSYRNAESILELVKPLLNELKCELHCCETIELIGDRFYVKVEYTLFDETKKNILAKSVGYAREQDSKSGMDAAQITGAATSYAKKYALCNLFHIDDSRLDPDEELLSRLQKQKEEEDKNKQGQGTTTTTTTTAPQTTTPTTTAPNNKPSERDMAGLVLECNTVNEAKEYLKANKIDIKKYPDIQAELNKKFNLK